MKNFSLILEIGGVLAPLIIIILLILINRNYMSIIKTISKRLSLQEKLLDLMFTGVPPFIREIANKIKSGEQVDIEKELESGKGDTIQRSYHSITGMREEIEDAKENATDPMEIANYNEQLKEIDGVITLLSTLDEDSSPEFVDSVMKDVKASLMRLVSKGGGPF